MIDDIDATAFQIRLPWADRVLLAAAIVVVGYCFWQTRRDMEKIRAIGGALKAAVPDLTIDAEPASSDKTPVM